MQGKNPTPNAQNARVYRAGVAKRLDAIERKVDALLAATLQNGVGLPTEVQARLKDAFKSEDHRR